LPDSEKSTSTTGPITCTIVPVLVAIVSDMGELIDR
jgi:hypothetical protein